MLSHPQVLDIDGGKAEISKQSQQQAKRRSSFSRVHLRSAFHFCAFSFFKMPVHSKDLQASGLQCVNCVIVFISIGKRGEVVN